MPGGFYLSGLDPGRSFELSFFATRFAAEVRSTRYQVLGANLRQATPTTSGPDSGRMSLGNNSTLLRLKGLRPDRLGRLFVDLERAAGAFAYVGLLEFSVGRPKAGPARDVSQPGAVSILLAAGQTVRQREARVSSPFRLAPAARGSLRLAGIRR